MIILSDDEDDLKEIPNPGTRPASTFYTTSMSMVQNQQAQRKTLGTRRTMQGWSVKHSQMPKPRRP
jgi:DNA helicase-2/ATP-dependent DNA helicase PcrA